MKANKKSIERKYRETQHVDIDDVRAMAKYYENKIKRLKFLLNDTIEKKDKQYSDCWWKSWCVKNYAKQFIKIYEKQLKEIPQKTFDSIDEYFKEIGYEESLDNFDKYLDSH